MTYREEEKRACPACGGAVEEGMSRCPYCGENLVFAGERSEDVDPPAMNPIGVGPRACAIIIILMGVVLLLYFLLGNGNVQP
ncbi:MAG: hypothetical protein JW885_03185 [Deltaproteobacteria bacterium]|nr:hypothetical protein [Candidatus Zymogenaceae bacterium]